MDDYRILVCHQCDGKKKFCLLCHGTGTYNGYNLLQATLSFMEIPDYRRDDLHWIIVHLGAKNSNHKLYNLAVNLATSLLRNKKKIEKEDAMKKDLT